MLKTLSGLGVAVLLFTQGCSGADPASTPTPAATTARSEELPRDVASVDLTVDEPLRDTVAVAPTPTLGDRRMMDRPVPLEDLSKDVELRTDRDRQLEVDRQMPWTGKDDSVASMPESKTGLSAGRELALKVQRDHQAEQEFAELALLNTKNPKIREVAQTIFDDHEVAENMLRKAAATELPRIPELSLEQDRAKEKMGELRGAELDTAFLKAMVEDHERELAFYKEQSTKAPTAELRAYFAEVTPVLQKHLTHCKKLQASL